MYMNTAIVYYSLNGNTAWTAGKIAAGLHADVIEIKPEKQYPDSGFRKFLWGGKSAVMAEKPELEPYSVDPEQYDRIIFGSPVWASNIAPPLRTFVADNETGLSGKRMAAYVCQSGSGGEKAFAKLSKCMGEANFESTGIFIDPKDKNTPEVDKAIEDFGKELLSKR